MRFDPPLIKTKLIKRYKRFLADVELADGSQITVHCANPGSMLGLTEPGIEAWISDSQNPKRKLRYSLEMVKVGDTMVGVNTNAPNKLAVEAINEGIVPSLTGYETMRREVKYGTNSRIDILLQDANKADTYVEVKNVHFVRNEGIHEFPDSVTERGAKHLDEMSREIANGNRAVMLYIVQRNDGDRFRFAEDLDPNYVEAFRRAHKAGVEAFAVRCDVQPDRIHAKDLLQIDLP